jgi:hypothetical protein
MRRTVVPLSVCRSCGDEMDRASSPFTDRPPKPGALSMCLTCGALSRFGPDLLLEPVSQEEIAELRARSPGLAAKMDEAARLRAEALPPWLRKEWLA